MGTRQATRALPTIVRGRSLALALAVHAAASVGASAPSWAQSDAPAPPPIPALDIDPTEKIDVTGWWSNGRELLLIQGDGGYKLWKGTNRFLAPDDIGRWDRQTYRTLWLETYRGEKHSRDRAHLRREDGTLLLSVRDLQPMQQLAIPPHTREDTLVGVWSGPPGKLQLREDGTYSFSVSASGPKDRQPARLGSHSGTWLVRDDTLVLSQGNRTKPVVATIITPVAAPPAPGAAGTSPSGNAPPPQGSQPPAQPASPSSPPGAPASAHPTPARALPMPLPHQLLAPEGTTIVMPGGEMRREAPADAAAR